MQARESEIVAEPIEPGAQLATVDATDPTPREHEPAYLRLLGAVETLRPRAERWGNERRYRLAAYLALHGDWVHRDRLADLFWPDRTQQAARSNLRKLLLEVRALGLPQLETDRNSLRWRVSTDVAEFEAALKRGDTTAALALYGGPALHGLEGGDSQAYSTWLEGERRKLHTQWRDSIITAIPQHEPGAVLQLARRLLDHDPCDEDALVAALNSHESLGDRAGATQEFRRYAERLIEDLGIEPSTRVRAAARWFTEAPLQDAAPPRRRAGDTATGAATVLPADGFIGRAVELQELAALLNTAECRLLTVTGPGGMGKSRLVKEAVRRLAGNFADGVVWIALDDLTDVAQVAPRIAIEMDLALGPKQNPIERVASQLATRQSLLVFDNSEHLPRLDTLIGQLIAAAPRLQVLSTSRARIGCAQEWLMPLAGLAQPLPDAPADDCAASAAVQLFVAQAKATHPRFDANASMPQVARLVRALGGLPLAILLAASWVRLLPVHELVNEITQSLDVLESAEEGEERPEHRSVRATFDQSWRLLAPAEQRALAALSVMAGTFRRSAATDVAQAPLPLLAALVDKSLLQVDELGRFSLHPLIAQFAAEQLALDLAARFLVRDRHAEAFARFLDQFKHFEAIDQPAAVRAIAVELPNVLAAWNWAIARPCIDVLQRCSAGLSNYYQARGPIAVGAELFARAQQTIDAHSGANDGPAHGAAWGVALEHAALNYWLGNYPVVEASGRKALAGARVAQHKFGIRSSLNTVAMALLQQGRLREAAQIQEQALAHATSDRAISEVTAYSGNLVGLQRELGDNQAALRLALKTLNGHRANGHRIGEMSMTNELGLIHHALGQPKQAIQWYEQGLQLAAASDMDARRSVLLMHLASACLDAGELATAQQRGQEASQLMRKCGMVAHEPTCLGTLAAVEMAIGDLPSAKLHLRNAIVAAARIGTAKVVGPLLRDCAAYLERTADPQTALRCVACADAHRVSSGPLLLRYARQREQLRALLGAAARKHAETSGAALSLAAGLAMAESALGAA